jgi:hypothetical protein
MRRFLVVWGHRLSCASPHDGSVVETSRKSGRKVFGDALEALKGCRVDQIDL